MKYTPKQRELMRLWQRDELSRLNLLEGSVSSGKTWISLVLWAFWVKTMPIDGLYLMCAKSLTTLKRNCLLLLQEQVGKRNFDFSIPAKEGYLFGRRVIFEGANDARSESKIRGLTLQGAYCDELTQFPEDFFAMLLSRLRMPGAKLIATTNPDNPMHWLKRNYIDRADELDFLDATFTIDDNTELDPGYVSAIKKEYTGLFYQRFILGLWVAAEGLVYPMFSQERHVLHEEPETDGDYYVSSDYGIQNPNVWLLWRKERGTKRWICLKEDYYSGRDERHQLTDSQLVDRLDTMTDGISIRRVIIDPSAASMDAELRRRGYHTQDAHNEVKDGISDVCSMLGAGNLAFMDCCVNLTEEFGAYLWDSNAVDRGEDVPLKENDHCLTGDTLVDTLCGQYRIDELVGKCGFVYCTDGETKQDGIFDKVRMTRKEADVFEVELADGRSVKATADHPILTQRGWVMIKELLPTDKIACIEV